MSKSPPLSAAVLFALFALNFAASPHSHMILPLTISYPNSSRRAAFENGLLRRRLDDVAARMRLYDDLLTNGYYTTRLFIGTPPQEFALIVDSGSTVTYVPCENCEQCGNHQDPRFQPDLSSTYEPVKCNIDCTCDNEQKQCIYERQYAEMSSSRGVLGEDLISFGDESILKPQRATFGCENSETGDIFSQHADGIMGLGRGQPSIMDQLVDKGVISDSFSLSYGGMDIGGGTMVLGEIALPSDVVFAYSDPVRSPYYNIELKEIHVDSEPLQLDPKVFDSKHGTVLDSGTTYAYLPEEAFKAFKNAISDKLKSLNQILGPDPNYRDICFSGAGSNVSELSNIFPKVDMVFGDGEKLTLSPENYFFGHSKVQGAYCLGVFQNGKDPTTFLGGIVVRNTPVIYDRQNDRIGFWKTNCSELWERILICEVPSPAPSAYTNYTIFEAPAPSPDGLEEPILPGHYVVGLITFDLSLNITYTNLVPNVEKLTKLIAQELDIDWNQVQILNITRDENGTLIRLTIHPEESANFFPNSTAVNIISRLTEHRVHLPDNFGSYQLLEWNIEPPSRRTWWQQHLVALFLGVSMVAIFIFSTFIVWFFRRHGIKGIGAYRPVDATASEQELQPL